MRKQVYTEQLTCLRMFTHVYARIQSKPMCLRSRVIMRKHVVLQRLRNVYALFTLSKLIWGREQIAPDPK